MSGEEKKAIEEIASRWLSCAFLEKYREIGERYKIHANRGQK